MTSAMRKIWSIAMGLGLTAAFVAAATTATAQTDLNRFVPKLNSGNSYDDEFEDESSQEDSGYRPTGGQRNRRPQRGDGQQGAGRRQNPRHPSELGTNRGDANERRYSQGFNNQNSSGPRMASGPADNGVRGNRRSSGNGSGYGGDRSRGMYEDSALSRHPSTDNSNDRNRSQRGEEFDSGEMHGQMPTEEYERYPDMPASYQPAGGDYRNNRAAPNYGRSNYYGGMNGPSSQSGGNGFSRMGLGNMGFGGMGLGGMFGGGLASRPGAASGSPTPANPYVLPEPVVTNDAVYLDAEPVRTGKPIGPSMPMSSSPGGTSVYTSPTGIEGTAMPEGREWLPGGPIMGRSYDGYTNPQCNDCGRGCCGGDCGGNCGPRCGNNCGMYGGCEEGYDCCGGCGPNYGPFNGPYGRPWILAPLDFVFGGLWHCGPYWGACDPCGNWWWGQDLTVFGGVHDFRSPVNITGNSNFGFQEGVNWSMPLWHDYGIGAQVGFQATQSNLQNNSIDVYDVYRKQTFLTAGLFHRPCDGQGWQYGVVFDYLHDEFYQTFNVGQLRGELSWLWDCQNELGFWFAAGVMDSDNSNDDVFLGADEFSPINQYAFFYRRRFCRGGEGRLWGGFTDNSGGLVGADFRLPISQGWALETGFNYIINENNENDIARDETWNVGMNLVWYWGSNAKCRSLYRPLFNVADNGSFMVTRSGLIGP